MVYVFISHPPDLEALMLDLLAFKNKHAEIYTKQIQRERLA